MARYCVNKRAQTTGEHEVHRYDCSFLPDRENQDWLGNFANCADAVRAAKNKGYNNVDGCKHCSWECHSR